jgi:hypothetical protein
MTTTDPSPASQSTPEPIASAGPSCAESTGSTIETTERKVMVAICGLCIATFCAALLGIAFYVHVVAGLAALALIAWWLGSSIAEVLKETRERDSSNEKGQR